MNTLKHSIAITKNIDSLIFTTPMNNPETPISQTFNNNKILEKYISNGYCRASGQMFKLLILTNSKIDPLSNATWSHVHYIE